MSVAEMIFSLIKSFSPSIQMGIVIGFMALATFFLVLLFVMVIIPKDIKWGKFEIKSKRPEVTKRKKKSTTKK